MVIKYRLLKIMLRKAIYVPKGLDFFRYASNRINYHIRSRIYNPVISHPISLMIELTNHCQLKCKYLAISFPASLPPGLQPGGVSR